MSQSLHGVYESGGVRETSAKNPQLQIPWKFESLSGKVSATGIKPGQGVRPPAASELCS